MFGFLRRKKKPADVATPDSAAVEPVADERVEPVDDASGPAVDASSSAIIEASPPAAEPTADVAPESVGEATEEPVAPAPITPAPIPVPPPATGTAIEQAAEAASTPPAPAPAPESVPPIHAISTATTATIATADRRGWMSRLRSGLARTRGNIAGIFSTTRLDEDLYEELETALLTSDAGYEASTAVLEELKSVVRKQRLDTGEQARDALRRILADLLRPLEKPMDIDRAEPLVMMIAGVNGAGKTTSIGKLAHHLQREGKSILLAAGDTFRAAAREQLAEWGARNDVQVISQQGGDPGAVAFDAVTAGRARKTGVVMVDTAGRLPTQAHLMEELRKIRRVLDKAMPGSPHETLLVLDGNTGQNMLAQVKAFDATVPLTGLIVTKLDGTAKGGALVALAHQRREAPIPVYFIGVGEAIEDLQAFSADEFAQALIG